MIIQRFGSLFGINKIAGFLAGTALFLICWVPSRAQQHSPKELDVQPKVIRQSPPIYPYNLHRLNRTGQVLVVFIVNAEGRVERAYAEKATHPAFRQAAIDAVEKWRFEPGRKDGRAVKALMKVPIIFNILGEPNNIGWEVKRPRSFPDSIPAEFRWKEPPVMTDYSPPVYPRQALLEKRKGKVTVDFAIAPNGRVVSTRAHPEGDADFKNAAMAAVQTFRFDPAKNDDGQPSGALLKMEFNFVPSFSGGEATYTDEIRRMLKVIADPGVTLPTLKDLDHMPKAVAQRSPTIPPDVLKAGKPAEALVEFIISRNGLVLLPHVINTTDEAFGYAAVQATADWGFIPPEINGERVDVVARIPVSFNPDAAPH